MGLSKSSGNFLYLNVSSGFLKNKQKQIEARSYTGTLLGITTKTDTFEGKPNEKVEVKMKDNESEEIAIIQFSQETFYATGFFSRIEKIDLTKPFTIGVSQSEQNEKVSFAWLKQDGVGTKQPDGKFKIEADPAFPKADKVDIGKGKFVYNYTNVLVKMEQIIESINAKVKDVADSFLTPEEKEREKNLNVDNKSVASGATTSQKVVAKSKEVVSELPTDDLPF